MTAEHPGPTSSKHDRLRRRRHHPRSTVQRRRHSGRYPRALQAAARLQASRGTSAHHLGLREPFISAVLKTSLTLRPSGRLDAWRRQFDASEDDLVRVAARGGRGHGPEQRARLGLAARSCSAHRAANLRTRLPTPWMDQRTSARAVEGHVAKNKGVLYFTALQYSYIQYYKVIK